MPVGSPIRSETCSPTRAPLPRISVLVAMVGILLTIGGSLFGHPETARSQPPDHWVWVEGEDASDHTFNGHGWYCCDQVRADLLSPGAPGASAGDWLAHYANDGRSVHARYDIEVPEDGEYVVWVRASSYQVGMEVRWDNGPPTTVDLVADPRERINLVAPGIDIRFLAWHRLGRRTLGAGAHRLEFILTGHPLRNEGQEVHGGIDALVLASEGWAPTGALQPDALQRLPAAADAWYPLIPSDDPFSDESVTDASHLLHTPAGRFGPLQRDGDRLRFAEGPVVKMWGVNAHPPATDQLAERQARWLAKHGINLVRLHPVQGLVGLLIRDPESGERVLDPQRLDRLDRWFATLKAHGIYMAWSPFYPHVITPADGYPQELFDELPARDPDGPPPGTPGRSTSGLVNVMPALQDAEWDWLETLLDHRNPYTGLRYVDDPALAIVETHNEDSIFWHAPLNQLQGGEFPRHRALLQAEWMGWLRQRYEDDAALRAAWGPVGAGSRPGDSLSNDAMPIYGAWEFTADGPPQHPQEQARMGDWIRFLAERQRAYFERREERLRDAGFQGTTITTAWQAGGPAAHAANLWTDTAADMIDRHAYFGGGEGGHNVRPGTVNNGTHLERPALGILARGMEQVEDRPFMMSEWTQSPPNQWKAEIAPLFAMYGMGLHGWDASTHFAANLDGRMGGGWPRERSYVTETPHYAGQFPAIARMVHERHFQESRVVAARRLATDDLFRGVDPLTRPVPSGGWPDAPGGAWETPPEVFGIGRTTLQFGESIAPSERIDWSRYIDTATDRVSSTTGQLVWHGSDSVVEARSPVSQGLVGWAGVGDGGGEGRQWNLPALDVEVRTPFVSLLVTSLDERPLAGSGHWLITALARDRQTGTEYADDGNRLVEVGGPPLWLEPVQARITIPGRTISRAGPLDIHGVPTGEDLPIEGEGITIDGRYRTYLYEVEFEDVPAGPTATRTLPAVPTATTATPVPDPTDVARIVLPWLVSQVEGTSDD